MAPLRSSQSSKLSQTLSGTVRQESTHALISCRVPRLAVLDKLTAKLIITWKHGLVFRCRFCLLPLLPLVVQFMKQTMGVTEDDPQAGLKNDLKQLFAKLCGKLDSLCNFHYTPKAVVPEMKVIYIAYCTILYYIVLYSLLHPQTFRLILP